MKKNIGFIAALALMHIPVSAQAMDQKALDCGVTKASPGLREALTDPCVETHGFTPLQNPIIGHS